MGLSAYPAEDLHLGSFEGFDKLMQRLSLQKSYAISKPFFEAKAAQAPEKSLSSMLTIQDHLLPAQPKPPYQLTLKERPLLYPEVMGDHALLTWWYQVAYLFNPTPKVDVDPAQKEAVAFLNKLKATGKKRKVAVTVGEATEMLSLSPSTKFPTEAFSLVPVTSVLKPDSDQAYSFPLIPGEAIGQEWWHFEVPKSVRGKCWLELMGEIGWLREGLDNVKRKENYSRLGLGYREEAMRKAVKF